MPDTNGIIVHQMIVHKVDHKNFNAPQLSDLESPVSEEVGSFLAQMIATNREHKYARSALFSEPEEGSFVLRAACDDILSDTDSFVPQSQAIARHLFESMDRRTSPGDLVICTFSESQEDASRWLALLKMDPEDGFVGERRGIDGQIQVVLRLVADVLPRGELQKCAFIVPQELREQRGYHLRVLDQQAARYGTYRMVATFFITRFLQCKVEFNTADKMRAFLYSSYGWTQQKIDYWPESDIDRFKRHTVAALEGNIVDVTEVAQSVIGEPSEQDEYYEYLRSKGLEDFTFRPDPDERRRLTKYTYFEGDHGLKIRIEADAVGPDGTLEFHKDEGANTWIVTIRTTHWRENMKRGR